MFIYRSLGLVRRPPGALVVQERMRVDGDEMGWNWMEQFLYWAKTNSKYGSSSPGDDSVGAPPPVDGEGEGDGGGVGGGEEGRGAKGKRVKVSFGAVGVGIEGDEEDRKTRWDKVVMNAFFVFRGLGLLATGEDIHIGDTGPV